MPPAIPGSGIAPPPPPIGGGFRPASTSGVLWGPAFRKCMIAGAATTFVILIAGNPLLIMLALLLGGWLAVFLYARGDERPPVTGGIGARIGAVAGLVAYGLYAVVMAVVVVFQKGRVLEEVKNALKAAAAQNPNPQAQQMVEKLMTPEGIAVLVTASAVILFFIFLVLCSIGGAIGGSFSKEKGAA